MKELTNKQIAKIKKNLKAFQSNFPNVKILYDSITKGFFVFVDESHLKKNNYIQFCYSLDYLNGYLYGVIQGVFRGLEFTGSLK